VTEAPSPLSRWLAYQWAIEPEIGSVDVEGGTVRYRRWRGSSAGATPRPGLVFVHGFLAHARWWDHIAPRFRDRFDVIAPDFTGMGDSDRRPAYARRQYSREILAAATHAGLTDVTLVAHSFGGLCALNAALVSQGLVRRVILIDAHVFRTPKADDERRKPEAERHYATAQEAMARYRLRPPAASPVAEIVAYIARHSLRESEGRWGWKFDPQIMGLGNDADLRRAVRTMSQPVDFIHAECSAVIRAAEAAELRAQLRALERFVTIPASDHHIMIEQPVALIAALEGLLNRPPCLPRRRR